MINNQPHFGKLAACEATRREIDLPRSAATARAVEHMGPAIGTVEKAYPLVAPLEMQLWYEMPQLKEARPQQQSKFPLLTTGSLQGEGDDHHRLASLGKHRQRVRGRAESAIPGRCALRLCRRGAAPLPGRASSTTIHAPRIIPPLGPDRDSTG